MPLSGPPSLFSKLRQLITHGEHDVVYQLPLHPNLQRAPTLDKFFLCAEGEVGARGGFVSVYAYLRMCV
ncbi:hypothetical protein EON65_53345 [archaeon]|nr:MAG: hypothetical protein EON65_53345 [archaeon]